MVEEQKKVIFTDSYKTKDLIWEAYTGYTEHYNNYVMMKSISEQINPITLAGLNKYAYYFYYEIKDFLEDFEKEITNIEYIKEIFEKERIENGDYKKIRLFQAQFMKITDIKNVIKDKIDSGDSVLENR